MAASLLATISDERRARTSVHCGIDMKDPLYDEPAALVRIEVRHCPMLHPLSPVCTPVTAICPM
jgi:hypothetical protein